MKRLILTAVTVLFSILTMWAQTGTNASAVSAPVVATHTQDPSTGAHRQRRHKHHSHQQHHRHSGVNAMR